MASTAEPRMITIPLSPFNELGRWSMERARIPYREEKNGLIFHVFASRRAGGKGTTPALVTEDGTIGESAEIAEWAGAHQSPDVPPLYPPGESGEEVRALIERWTGEDLALPARRIFWQHLIDDPDLAARTWSAGVPERHKRWMPRLLRVMKPLTKRSLGLSREQVESAPRQIAATFDDVARRLDAGGPYLFGSELTAADIAFAALSSPALLVPEGYPAPFPTLDEVSETVRTQVTEFRKHPAGQYALKLYREERQTASR